jgi:MFS family permease
MGVWIQRLAIGWQAWELSESAVLIGLVAALHLLPSIVLTPFFGVLVDRVDTRRAAIATHVALTLVSLGMGAITLAGNMSTTWLLLLSLLHGIANSAYSPIRFTLIVDLVEKQQYPSAVAITSMTFNLSRFVGPAIAGWIVAVYGLGVAYLVNAVTYVPLIISFLLITIKRHDGETTGPSGYLDQLVEGLRYTRDHTLIRNIILIASTSSLFGRGILELLPAFAALIFEGGSNVLAIFMAVAGVGALGTSLFFSVRPGTSHLYRIVLLGAVGVGISIGLFATVTSLLGGIIAVTLLGICTSLVSVGSQIQVQLSVEDRLRGRVMSLWGLIVFGGPAVGGIVAGIAVRELGTTNTLVIFATLCILLNFLFARGRRIDSDGQ